jgi:hypothetical protein
MWGWSLTGTLLAGFLVFVGRSVLSSRRRTEAVGSFRSSSFLLRQSDKSLPGSFGNRIFG